MNRKQLCTFSLLNSGCGFVLSLHTEDISGMFHSLFPLLSFFNFKEIQSRNHRTPNAIERPSPLPGNLQRQREAAPSPLPLASCCFGPLQIRCRIKSVAGWVPQEADSELKINMLGVLWSTPVEERGQWEKLINPNKAFKWPHREPWSLGGPSELAWVGARGWEFIRTLRGSVIDWAAPPGKSCDLGQGSSLQVRQSPKRADSWGPSSGSTPESCGESLSFLKRDLRRTTISSTGYKGQREEKSSWPHGHLALMLLENSRYWMLIVFLSWGYVWGFSEDLVTKDLSPVVLSWPCALFPLSTLPFWFPQSIPLLSLCLPTRLLG